MRIRLSPREGWATVILLMLLFLSVTWSISVAGWAQGLNVVDWAVIMAVLTGMALAKIRRLPGVISHILATILGCTATVWLVSRWMPPYLPVGLRMAAVITRLQTWMETAIGEGMSSDNTIFVLELAMIMWALAYIGSWFLFRRNRVLAAVVPAGVALLINLYYGPSRLFAFSFVFLLCALLLVVRSHVFSQQQHWEKDRVLYHPDIGWDFLKEGAILAACIILATWLLPAAGSSTRLGAVWTRLAEPWETVQIQWNRMFTSLNYERSPHPGLFGATMSLGGAMTLTQDEVLEVESSEARYWRAAVYDSYTGRGWVNTDSEVANLEPDSYWPVENYRLTTILTQTVSARGGAEGIIYAASDPIWTDVGTRVQLHYSQIEGNVGGRTYDAHISVARSKPKLAAGETYTVLSAISYADMTSLRAAGQDYPDWILARYLGLPESLPDRVVDLAQSVVEGTRNPYDAAEAIQGYLRREMTYNLAIDPPPNGVDAVDYFLFESKTGYCDYYASAMVVLARAAGIPARVASGYTAGKWDSDRNLWDVRQANSHSWPELFFPDYGWIAFEPTASEPVISRPLLAPEAPAAPSYPTTARTDPRDLLQREKLLPDEPEDSGGLYRAPSRVPTIRIVGIAVLDVLLAAAIVLLFRRRLRVARMGPAERAYDRLVRSARWLGVRPQKEQTPFEFAAALARVLPAGAGEVRVITEAYVWERFAGKGPAREWAERLDAAWRSLRMRFPLQWWENQRGRFAPKDRPSGSNRMARGRQAA